jgi:membrane protein
MINPILAWRRFFGQTIWQPDPSSRLESWCYPGLQILFLAYRDLMNKGALVRTSALAYATVLALIPLLALLFAIFKGVGLQRLLAAHLLPQLAGGSQDFARQIITYVETTNVASLGVFGVIWLLVALMILMANIEQAFNHIWRISRARPWWRKLSDYLSIFLLFPIIMAVAISITTAFQSHPEIQKIIRSFVPEMFFSAYQRLFSFGMVWLGFTFVYLVMPNTRVQLISALLGGLIGGTIWQAAQWLFQWFQSSAPYYNAIYGALYQLLFIVIWMFWSWLIVLYGAEAAYTHQNLASLRRQFGSSGNSDNGLEDEYLALMALLSVGERFCTGESPLSLKELAQFFNDQEQIAANSLKALQRCGLVMPVALYGSENNPRFLPSRPLEQIRVKEALACLRHERHRELGGMLGNSHHLACLVGKLVEQPGSEWQDVSLQELLNKVRSEPKETREEPTRQQNTTLPR